MPTVTAWFQARLIVDHTRSVLNHYRIHFTEISWCDFPDLLASGGASGLRVVVLETGVAYTDEHLRLPEDVIVPVIRVVTDSAPLTGQILTGTPLMGFGVPGAINAGLQAARILALNDHALRNLLQTKPYPGQ